MQYAQSCFAYQRVFSKWLMALEPLKLDKERPQFKQTKQIEQTKLANRTRPDKTWQNLSLCSAQSCFAYQRVFSKWLMAPEPQTLDKERKHLDLLRPPYHEAWRSTRAALEQTWQRSATDTHSTKEPKIFRNCQFDVKCGKILKIIDPTFGSLYDVTG